MNSVGLQLLSRLINGKIKKHRNLTEELIP